MIPRTLNALLSLENKGLAPPSDHATRASHQAPTGLGHSAGIVGAIGPDTFHGDDATLRQSIKALVEMDMEGALVPHGIGGHASKLLTAAYHRLPAPQDLQSCQARELTRLADLTLRRKPVRCFLGFHRFGAYERLILTSRHACTRCGAVYLSTGFDGLILKPEQSRAELISAAQAIEARQGGNGEAGAVHESAVSEGNAPNINHLPHDRKDSKKGVSRG